MNETNPQSSLTVRPDVASYLRFKLWVTLAWALFFFVCFVVLDRNLALGYPVGAEFVLANYGILALAAVVTSIIFMFIFGTFGEWLVLRSESWNISASELRYRDNRNQRTDSIPLQDVETARPHFPAGVRLRLKTGQAVVMRFPPHREKVLKLLNDRIAAISKAGSK